MVWRIPLRKTHIFCPHRFIGELFKLKMLTENIMHDCVLKLLRSSDDDNLECLCRLLTTIGKDLDHEKAKVRRFVLAVASDLYMSDSLLNLFAQSVMKTYPSRLPHVDIPSWNSSLLRLGQGKPDFSFCYPRTCYKACCFLLAAASISVLPADGEDCSPEEDLCSSSILLARCFRAS